MKYLFLFSLLISSTLFAQKKVLDHTVYNNWKRVGDIKISDDGKYSVYTIKPHRGDGYLYIVNNETGKKDSVFRAINPVFAGDNSFVAFKITPGFDTLRKSELNKVKKDKWPKDSLGIFLFKNSSLQKFAKVKSFFVSPESNWLVYLQDGNKLPEVKKRRRLFKRKSKEKPYESNGNIMVLLTPTPASKDVKVVAEKTKDVKQIYMPKKGNFYAYISHRKEKVDSLEIRISSPNSATKSWNIPQKFNAISDLSFNQAGNAIVFTASLDTAETKNYQLFYADLLTNKFTKLVDTVHANLPVDQRVSNYFAPYFSHNGQRVFFGIAEKQKPQPKDTLLENEKAKLDVWNWKDDRLQPQQLVEREDDENKTKLSVFNLRSENFHILGADTLEVRPLDHGNSDFAVAYSIKPYQKAYNWEYPNKKDIYLIHMNTGEKKQLGQGLSYNVSLSPSGNYFVYFDAETRQINLTFTADEKKNTCVTCLSNEEWLEDVNGMPHLPAPFGVIGWTRNETLMLQSKYDIWLYNPNNNTLQSLTKKQGSAQKIRFAFNEWNADSTFIDYENMYITGFHEKDKSTSLYKLVLEHGDVQLVKQFETAHSTYGFKKAKKSTEYVYQKASVSDYPDVQLADWNSIAEAKKISLANPQQSEYNWATVELLSWKSYGGVPLEGLLYKPENYDSTKKYPLLVYFYELYSDDLHNHSAPRPTASIIFPTEYASAGYFVLIPDIRYKPGYPARGAYDCIMSGTDYVLKKYKSVDSTRMGLQGQSWGGYQTAQLITMTTRYKAAMAGAPVGNMFSAYGGIRWGSGLNRQFQYERTQSRIGKTIWEAPELYVENSPLFHLPKVQTPLLMMHNDADGSVPWYQGVEIFTGLKRLDKPVWLLNYNGDDHNLMKNANRIDLSIRMRQFFDYYLMDKPAPKWLIEGVPAVDKGKKYGLETGN